MANMRVTSWNVQHLFLYDFGADFEPLLHAELDKQRADVLLLQEVDRGKERSYFADQTRYLASKFGTEHFSFQETVLVPPEDGQYGIGVVSKIPVLSWHHLEFRGSPIGKRMTFSFDGYPKTSYVHDHPRAAIAAVLDNGWVVVNTHLSFMPFYAQWQMLKVARWAKRIAHETNSRLLIGGDFNFENTWLLRLFGLRDAVHGLTFPLNNPHEQIDHIMIDAQTQVLNSHVADACAISDHRWISVEVAPR